MRSSVMDWDLVMSGCGVLIKVSQVRDFMV